MVPLGVSFRVRYVNREWAFLVPSSSLLITCCTNCVALAPESPPGTTCAVKSVRPEMARQASEGKNRVFNFLCTAGYLLLDVYQTKPVAFNSNSPNSPNFCVLEGEKGRFDQKRQSHWHESR